MKHQINSDRIVLRKINPIDVDDLFEIYGCSTTMQFAADPVFESRDVVYEMLESVNELESSGQSFEWAIFHKTDEKIIGTCSLHSFSQSEKACEVGCMLNKTYWGKGLMQESLTVLFDYARSFGIDELRADIDSENIRSIELFKRLGFRKLGDAYVHRLDSVT
jgi:ribosomal-protein-alanine N-acetyltransferase